MFSDFKNSEQSIEPTSLQEMSNKTTLVQGSLKCHPSV